MSARHQFAAASVWLMVAALGGVDLLSRLLALAPRGWPYTWHVQVARAGCVLAVLLVWEVLWLASVLRRVSGRGKKSR